MRGEAFSETVAAAELVGNHSAAICARGYLAIISADKGDWEEAAQSAEGALLYAGRQKLDEHWVTVMAHYAAGESAGARGDIVAARAAIERGLHIATRGGLRLDTVHGLLALTRIATDHGDEALARGQYARAERQLSSCADPGRLRERFERSRPSHARHSAASRPNTDELSQRELAVLRMFSSQLSMREIGNELYISFNTVKTHARNVYAKLRVSSREEAVARARELDLL